MSEKLKILIVFAALLLFFAFLFFGMVASTMVSAYELTEFSCPFVPFLALIILIYGVIDFILHARTYEHGIIDEEYKRELIINDIFFLIKTL